jgi:hypothetical protein
VFEIQVILKCPLKRFSNPENSPTVRSEEGDWKIKLISVVIVLLLIIIGAAVAFIMQRKSINR